MAWSVAAVLFTPEIPSAHARWYFFIKLASEATSSSSSKETYPKIYSSSQKLETGGMWEGETC